MDTERLMHIYLLKEQCLLWVSSANAVSSGEKVSVFRAIECGSTSQPKDNFGINRLFRSLCITILELGNILAR